MMQRMKLEAQISNMVDMTGIWFKIHFIESVKVAFYGGKNHIQFEGSVADGMFIVEHLREACAKKRADIGIYMEFDREEVV